MIGITNRLGPFYHPARRQGNWTSPHTGHELTLGSPMLSSKERVLLQLYQMGLAFSAEEVMTTIPIVGSWTSMPPTFATA